MTRGKSGLRSVLRRSIIGAAILLISAGLTACWDEEKAITQPQDPSLSASSGTWPPELSSHVRYQPLVVSAGKTYRVWFLLRNTAPQQRRYIVMPWPVISGGPFEFSPLTSEYTLAAGERRWVPIQLTVNSSLTDADYEFYVTAYDFLGEQHGKTTDTLRVQVANSRPVVAVLGGEHHVVGPGQLDTISVWMQNPRNAARDICFRWLEDEGSVLGDMPQPITGTPLPIGGFLCKNLPAGEGFDTAFVYRYGSTGVRRQTLQAWTMQEPNDRVHAFRKTTVAASAPQTNRFYGWTETLKPNNGIPLQAVGEYSAAQDRQFVSWTGCNPAVPGQAQWDQNRVNTFAKANPGQSYYFVDEPGQGNGACSSVSPDQYAIAYHDFVKYVRNLDPSARLSPGGFEEPNAKPGPHFTEYAEQFLTSYRTRYTVNPSVWEWRFHAFGYDPSNLSTWHGWVNQAEGWSRNPNFLPRPMVLGSFGFPHTVGQTTAVQNAMIQMMDAIKSKPHIVGAAWWTYHRRWQYWLMDGNQPVLENNNPVTIWCDKDKVVNGRLYHGTGCRHSLADSLNILTPEGNTYRSRF